MCWIRRMAWARYGGERGAGPLAARGERAHAATGARPPRTARRCGPRRRRIRLADTRRLGKLVGWRIPGVDAVADLPRAVPRLPVHRARARPTRRSSPACAGGSGRSPATTRRSTARSTSRPGTSRARSASRSPTGSQPPTTAAPSCTPRRACSAVDTQRPAAAEGGLGAARPVRAPGRRGAARAGRPAGRGRRPRMRAGWSRTRCARVWMTRSGSRRRAACSPRRAGRRSTASPR